MWTDSYYPYISGVTRSVATTREALERLGNRVYVFCPSYPGAVPEEKVYRFPSFRAPTNPDYYVGIPVPWLVRKARSLSPDVVHIHSPFNLGKAGLKAARAAGAPCVMTYHTMYSMYAHYVPFLGNRVSRIVERLSIAAAQSCDAVIAPSRPIQAYLLERGLKRPVWVIPSGINVSEFRVKDRTFLRRTLGISQEVPIVLTCGRLGTEKNLDTLIRAFALVARKVPSVLVLVGDGPLRNHLENLCVSLGLSGRVFFAGRIQPDKMPLVYAGADLFLFTSLTDTQGLVLAEAKAAGLPIVAVKALGAIDMVEHNVDGFLCENQVDEIAGRVGSLLEDRALLTTMSQNAAKNALRFSTEESVKALLQCYRSF